MTVTQDYLQWLRQQHRYADNTVVAVQRDLQALIRWLSAARPAGQAQMDLASEPSWSVLTVTQIRAALARAHSAGLSPSTLSRMASSWRGFFRYVRQQGLVTTDLVQGIRAPRKPRRLPKALSPDEALALLVTPTDSNPPLNAEAASELDASPQHQQAVVLAELLYGSGLRIAEALGLDRSAVVWRQRSQGGESPIGGWLDLDAAEVHVVGKGRKPRVVPLTRIAIERLQAWLDVPIQWPPDFAERPVFFSSRGQRLSSRGAQRLLANLSLHTGVGRHVHPHMLRHSFASHLLQSSGDLRAVQELMGHASIASTQVYTALDFQHLSAVYDKAHPRARKRPE